MEETNEQKAGQHIMNCSTSIWSDKKDVSDGIKALYYQNKEIIKQLKKLNKKKEEKLKDTV